MKKCLFKKVISIICALAMCVTMFAVCAVAVEAESFTELTRIDFSSDAYGYAYDYNNDVSYTNGISWFSNKSWSKRVWADTTGAIENGDIALKSDVTTPVFFTLGADGDTRTNALEVDAGKYRVSLNYLPALNTKAGSVSVYASKTATGYLNETNLDRMICKGSDTFEGSPETLVKHAPVFDFSITDSEYAAGFKYIVIMLTPAAASGANNVLLWIDDIVVSKSNIKDNATRISFESDNAYFAYWSGARAVKDLTTGLFDFNKNYSSDDKTSTAAWYKTTDPDDADNTCLRGYIGGNSNTTHFAVTLADSSPEGFYIRENTNYLVTFKYKTKGYGTNLTTAISGSKRSAVGTTGNKSSILAQKELRLSSGDNWNTASYSFYVDPDTAAYSWLIIRFSGQPESDDLVVYVDDVVITESSTTFAESVTTYNNNGKITMAQQNVGDALITPEAISGATFKGWYNEDLIVPYTRVPYVDATLYAKYDATVLSFEQMGYYDPYNRLGGASSSFAVAQDPTDSSNKVLKANLNGNTNNNNIGLGASSYATKANNSGYKLTAGNQYVINFKYYATNVNSSITVSFRGKDKGYLGTSGGSSGLLDCCTIASNSDGWQSASVSFTYEDIQSYLALLIQDTSGKATVYFDDIVIKETVAEEVITPGAVSIGNYSIGSTAPNVVIPASNFPYLATMQIDELVKVVKTKTNADISVKKENSVLAGNSEIIIGDVERNIISSDSLNTDTFAIKFADGKAYINGGSPYALAMGVSEFASMIKNAADGKSFVSADDVKGSYSEALANYDSASYYTPTFADDFNGNSVNTDLWNVAGTSSSNNEQVDGKYGKKSVRSASHTKVEDGCLVIDGAYDDDYFYGGKIYTDGKMLYKYGYLEMSAKLPYGAGFWSSLWCDSREGSGYFTGEYDINESYGDNKLDAVVHSWPTSAGTEVGKQHTTVGTESCTDSTFADEFHTYGLLWTSEKLVFTCDGTPFYTYSITSDDDIDAFNDYVEVIISLLVGADSSDAPNLNADYWQKSNKLVVDYLHLYQIDGQYIKFSGNTNRPVSTFIYSDEESVTYSVKSGTVVTPAAPVKTGYKFIGWYANGALKGTGSVTVEDVNTVYTPMWEPLFVKGNIVGQTSDVDDADLVALKRILLGFDTTGYNLDAADVNGDGSINIIDLVTLKKLLVKA